MAPNNRNMTQSNISVNVVDKRRAGFTSPDGSTRNVARSIAPFTANATGTTTTIVGANAAPGTNDNNVARRGEKFQLFTAAGALKESTVFTVSEIAVAGSTTLTFGPAAATAPVSTDIARWVGMNDFDDLNDMTARLSALGRSDSDINVMSVNDMVFALRSADNSDGI